ncbi:hypothetical protein DI09_67p20 [Mitosporidium daphniae]|uniref:Uncharacterized protein n=1 Tax=Mitosporidium daphniae TaxID=1485682 RepID=A0A098VNZ1_9MICR|nr:uncharacterized protein DI09_67p20 [Mitosporidium daphniae]KGG50514.1 hypothetical protein DI09_67p20 [Mitosporidium daphniae]|eukprot:XP_013236965.1 uncharacterized protein DI09_67p20 [Mitosporidium daphniae]
MELSAPVKRKTIWRVLTKNNGISVTPQALSLLLHYNISSEEELLNYLNEMTEICRGENGSYLLVIFLVTLLSDLLAQEFMSLIKSKHQLLSIQRATEESSLAGNTTPSIEILSSEKTTSMLWDSKASKFI